MPKPSQLLDLDWKSSGDRSKGGGQPGGGKTRGQGG
jgi:hypothetical protein